MDPPERGLEIGELVAKPPGKVVPVIVVTPVAALSDCS